MQTRQIFPGGTERTSSLTIPEPGSIPPGWSRTCSIRLPCSWATSMNDSPTTRGSKPTVPTCDRSRRHLLRPLPERQSQRSRSAAMRRMGESRSDPNRWKYRSSLHHPAPVERLWRFRGDPPCYELMALREPGRRYLFRSLSIFLREYNQISARHTTSVRLGCSPSSLGTRIVHTRDMVLPSRSTFRGTLPHWKRLEHGPAISL